ncbi:MAG: tail fiber domain-containing protein [Planctomycetota bacterium]
MFRKTLSRTRAITAAVGFAAVAMTTTTHAQPVPAGTAFTYQGRLADNGQPVAGPVDLAFRLYDEDAMGLQIGSTISLPGFNDFSADGTFSVVLDFGRNAFLGDARWLEIDVEGTTLTPRQPITPTPFALFALDGNEGPAGPQGPQGPQGPEGMVGPMGMDGPQGEQGPEGPVGPQGLVGPPGPQGIQGPPGFTGAQGIQGPPGDSRWGLNGSSTFYTTGNVGIGTTAPAGPLAVFGNDTDNAIQGRNSGVGAGVGGWNTQSTGIRDGVFGRSDSNAGRGVFGWSTSTTGNTVGVFGQTQSNSGVALSGIATATSGDPVAVYGEVRAAGGFGAYFEGPVGSQNYFQRSVGIGTTNPGQTLSVVGNSTISDFLAVGQTANPDAKLLVRGDTTGDAFRVRVGSSSKLVVKDNGGMAVGSNFSSVPANGMRVAGNVGINADPGSTTLVINGTASKPGGGLWGVFSDRRLKHHIEPLESGVLDRLLSLRGYTFEYTPEAIESMPLAQGRQTGLIAQEVQKAFPEWVETADDGYLFVEEKGFTAILVEALRELDSEKDREIEQLHAAARERDAEISRMADELEAMRTVLLNLAQNQMGSSR